MELPDFLKKIKHRVDNEVRKRLYNNLVFKGGGVRGIAYMGAMESLEELGIVEGVQRVAGTSAGAIAATMMSFGLSIPDTQALFDTLYTSNVPQSVIIERKSRFRLPADRESIARLFGQYGWYSSQAFHQWMEGIIADQCNGNGRATFADFQARGFRDLHIVAANVSRHRAEVFSAVHSPDVAVADAVRMSISIPIFFESLRFDGKSFGSGDYYVDGGLYDNFPMHIFDEPTLTSRAWAYRDGINWETLGLFLYPEQLRNEAEPEYPNNLWEFVNLTMRNVYYTQQSSSLATNSADKHRTIEVSDCGIRPTEFSITPGSEKYIQLHNSGRQAVFDFFELENNEQRKEL